ncbi:polysaccharide lyase family 7 protein [Aquimarina pacifica]|uniref:polysaccharide lyase family 7 protein n=1 Tax=Aquimarina pacifica TaxID=1296415 RepID=UPI00046F44DA|nr:polysaccharide lyase family 7 protein [Aquimarina pacifica]
MKTTTTILKSLFFSCIIVAFVGCSKDEISDIDSTEDLTSKTTSGGSCSSAVNFSDLVVETSWDSGDKDDRDTYGACGVDGEPWMDRYSDNRVMMKCLVGDGHRTELKEETGDEANLTKYKKMVFTAKYTSLPSHGVTIAQIHNRANNIKRPWLRLYIDSDRKFKIKETETNPTGSSSDYETYTGMKYASNGEVTITIWTGLSGQEKAKIRVDYDGDRFEETIYPTSAWNNYDDDFYLKAGVYTEGDDKTATVKYSAFSIKH